MKEGRIRSLEEIFLHSMPIKEHQIVDHFFPPVRSQCPLINSTPSTRLSSHATHRSVSQTAGKLKDEVMTIKPVQKQSSAGQRTRFKAYVAVGDFDGHIGLGKSRIRCRNQKRLKRRRRRTPSTPLTRDHRSISHCSISRRMLFGSCDGYSRRAHHGQDAPRADPPRLLGVRDSVRKETSTRGCKRRAPLTV